jgi:hypothetical protein
MRQNKRAKLPVNWHDAYVLHTRYIKANKVYRETIRNRYGFKNESNFLNKLALAIKNK